MNIMYAILPVITMITGFYIGFSIKKTDELPKSPKAIIEKKKEEKKEKKKEKILEQYIANIDNYPNNQKKIEE